MKDKLLKVLLTVVVTLSSIGGIFGTINAYAEDIEFDIDATVELSDDKTEANITFDLESVNEQFTVDSIKDSEGKEINLKSLTCNVLENGTYKFDINYYNNSDLETLLTYSKEIVVSGITGNEMDNPGVIVPEETQEDAPQKNGKVSTSSNGDKLSVRFRRDSGADIDWSNAEKIDWNFQTEEQIIISAEFAGKGASKTRTLEIDIPDGYTVIAYSAKHNTTSQAGEQILETTEIVQQAMTSSSLTARNGNGFGSQVIPGYKKWDNSEYLEKQKSGKITYVFNTEADKIELALRLGIDQKLYSFSDGRDLFDSPEAINVISKSTGQLLDNIEVKMISGDQTLVETVKANVKEGYADFYLHRGSDIGGVAQTYIDNGSSPIITPYGTGTSHIRTRHRTANNWDAGNLVEELVLIYKYPEGATFKGIDATPFTEAGNMDVVHDSENRQVKVTYKNILSRATQEKYGTPKFELSGEVYDAVDLSKKQTAEFTYTMSEKAYQSNSYISHSATYETVIVDKDVPFNIVGYNQSVYDYNENGFDFNNAYQFLGNYLVENPAFVAKENSTLNWTFNQGLGVKVARLAIPKESKLLDVKVYTTDNPNGTNIADMVSTDSKTGAGCIIDLDKLGFDQNSYITKITGMIDLYPASHSGANVNGYVNSQIVAGYTAYGKILDATDAKHTLVIDGVTADVTLTTANQRVLSAGETQVDALASSYYPGNKIPVRTRFSASHDSYSRDKQVTDNFIQDPTTYIRVPSGFTLDESSVKFRYLKDVTDKVTLRSKSIQSDGTTIYEYIFANSYDVLAGHFIKGDSVAYTNKSFFEVDFDLGIDISNQGVANLAISDVIMIEGKGNFRAYDSFDGNIRNDDFGLTNSGQNLMAPSSTITTSVTELPELQILSGIRVKDSNDDFYQYDGSEKTIAGLSKVKDAEIEVEYFNNSPNNFEKTNIYMPIPKEGKNYGKYFNNKAIVEVMEKPDLVDFDWSMNLTEAISVDGFTTYYAVDGEANGTSYNGGLSWEAFEPQSGWKTASQISNWEDVIFVKFESNSKIVSGAAGKFTFKLKADSNAPVDLTNYWRTYSGSQPEGSTDMSWVIGSVLAAELSVGKLEGQVFIDKNANGVFDAGDTLYTGSDIILQLTEESGKIPTTNLDLTAGSYEIDLLKQGNYTITAVNNNNSSLHFTQVGSGNKASLAVADAAHSKGVISNLEIVDASSEYSDLMIGLIEATPTEFKFEDRISGDNVFAGKAQLSLLGEQADYNENIGRNTFIKETFGIEPTVKVPAGYVHTGWDIYMVTGSTEGKIGEVNKGELSTTVVPDGAKLVVKAIVSFPPEITTVTLSKYVDDTYSTQDLLSNITAKDEAGNTMTLDATPVSGNTELTVDSIPVVDAKYSEAGTYGVNVKVKTTSGSYSEETLVVKVNKAPVVEAFAQEYVLGQDNIDAGVKASVTASWLKASDTVGTAPTKTTLTPTYTIENGPSNDFSKAGLYTVKYTATNDDNKTGTKEVKVLVLTGDAITDPTGTFTIEANGFGLGNEETSSFDASKAISKGNAVAYEREYDADGNLINVKEATDKVVVEADELKDIQEAPKQGGLYELTYIVKEGDKEASITVNVVVAGASTNIDDDLALSAQGFTLENTDAALLDVATAIVKGKAKAILISDGSVVTDIKVNSTELSAIQNANENGGIYDLTYTATSGTMETSVTVKVVVLGTGTPPPTETEDGDELAMNAHGFVLDYTEASVLTAEDAKIKSEVKAFLVQAQEEVTNIAVDATQLMKIQSAPKQGGVYNLTFTAEAADGTKNSVTIKVVVKGISTSIDDNLALNAEGFTLANEEAELLDEAEAIVKGKVEAILINSGVAVTDIAVDADELKAIQEVSENGGIYDLTYTATSGAMETSVTVKVVVLGTGTPPPTETEDGDELAMNAHGFVLDYTEAGVLTEDEAKTNSDVYAFLVQAQEEVTNITVDANELKAIQGAPRKGGVYDLTFTAEAVDGTTNSITVKVLVKPVGGITDPTGTYTIDADGFVVNYDEAKTLDGKTSKISSQAVAYEVVRDANDNIIDIVVISDQISVDADQLKDINATDTNGGIYGLTFTVGDENNSVSIEVPVLVEPKWNVSENNVVLGAEGFVLENSEAATLDTVTALINGKVSAYETILDAEGNIVSFNDLTDEITVDVKELKAIQAATKKGGIYDLTYSVVDSEGNTINRTVKVIVKGTHVPAPEGGSDQLAITANDFTISNSEASQMTVEKAIEKSGVEAWLVKEGTLVEVKVDEAQLKAIQEATEKGGEFELTFTATYEIDGELVTVEITITVTVEPAEEDGDVLGENTTTDTTGGDNQTVIKTGDSTNVMLYCGIGFISLFVVIIIAKQKKSKESVE